MKINGNSTFDRNRSLYDGGNLKYDTYHRLFLPTFLIGYYYNAIYLPSQSVNCEKFLFSSKINLCKKIGARGYSPGTFRI